MNQMVKDLYVRHAHPCLPLYEISYIVYALGYFHGYAFSHLLRPVPHLAGGFDGCSSHRSPSHMTERTHACWLWSDFHSLRARTLRSSSVRTIGVDFLLDILLLRLSFLR
jgi:hypothetical protein